MNDFIGTADYLSLISGEKSALFERYFELLTEYNARFNLTAITQKEDIYEKHFLDSIMGESLFPKYARVLEVGSGAGFPSLPLKIIRGDLVFTLVESTGKKCSFLQTAVKELGLDGVCIVNERAETLARNSSFRERFDAVCARAVAKLNTLSEYCLPFVRVGGVFVAYKGNAEEEIQEAQSAFRKLGGKERCILRYTLPTAGNRTLVGIEKIRPTPPSYPRGQGKERKNPL